MALVVVLGLIQYRFTHEYDAVIYQGEKILFRFDTLREHLTRSMLSGIGGDMEEAAGKVEALNVDLNRMLENTLVPGEYKLALINQVDLPGIALLIREVAENPDNSKTILQLHDQLRILSDNLMQFDRVLSGQMKTRLIRFQGLAIGALTLIIGSVSLLVLFLYQKAMMPLLALVRALQQPKLRDPLPVDSKACREIAELTEQINLMILEGAYRASSDNDGRGRFSFSPQELNKLSNFLNGIMNYTQLLIDEGGGNQDEEVLELLLKVRESSEKMGSIVQNKIGGKKRND
ncbi:MAG: hypothetical protein L3J79_10100 [Candidatus Marinimicrobia bacterium]|nr:hypothetical protein [Candidatus Neomarinimicrobiota bacterium]